jgi:hypothetical protein
MRQLRILSKLLFLFLSFTLANIFTYSQVGIGTSTPVSSAQLEVYSNSKGFLPPRLTQQERNSISSPVAGLVLWCSNCGTYGELQVYNGVTWVTAIGGVASNATAAVTTASASSISYTSATGGGTISSDGGAAITAYGICWSTSPNPDVSLGTKIYNSGAYSGAFSGSITGLTNGTTYYIRAFAVNSVGTSYGSQQTFTTIAYTAPTLTTTAASSISYTSATSGGNVSANGGTSITSYGICWSTSSGPTTALSTKTTANASVSGAFSDNLTGLTAGTTYYVRAYATNSVGTSYGSEVSFSTTALAVPTLTTTAASSITSSTATSGGTVSSNGGSTITSYGICWSTSTGPTTASSTKTTTNTSISGAFSENITGLSPLTTYYVRAYATNSVGTNYGSEVSFTTTAAAPTLTTTAASSITSSTATSGGNVSSNGGATITSYGICWSTSSGPTTALSTKTTTNASISGAFTGNLTGLSPSTTYYVRAYATNSIGTSYGNEISFTTSALNLAVGDSYQGGKVGYIFVSGDAGYVAGEQHGIIFSSADVGSGIVSDRVAWGAMSLSATYTCTSTNEYGVGRGQTNTNIILGVSGGSASNSVVKMCADYSVTDGGVTYSDWFLPSICELEKFYNNRSLIGNYTINGIYRSSNQCNSTLSGLSIWFDTGSIGCFVKDADCCTNKARAARYF